MLVDALDRLRNQPRPMPANCAVLVCLPMGILQFMAARYLSAALRRALGLESDYATQIAREFDSHADYDREVGQEVRVELHKLISAGVRVSFNSTFGLFSRTARQKYAVVMIIAHHAAGGIEFHDGVHSWDCVQGDLRTEPEVTSAMVFIVCESEGWKRDLTKFRVGPGALAAYVTEISPLDSVRFVSRWVSELNGERTLFEAMDRATRILWKVGVDR